MKSTVTFCILVVVAPLSLMGSPPVSNNTFCKEKDNGFYGNAYNCQYYYECRNKATKIRRCNENFKFDMNTEGCQQSANCLSSKSECVVDCSGHNHGDLFPNPEDCGSFYQCSWGVAYLHQCPRGLLFNPVINVCDWPENVDCGSNLFCEGGNGTTTVRPTNAPTTEKPVTNGTSAATVKPTSQKPSTTVKPTTTKKPTTQKPTTTAKPTTTKKPTTQKPTTTVKPTTTKKPTTQKPTTVKPTTTKKPTTVKPTTTRRTTEKPSTSSEEDDSNSSSGSSDSSESSESKESLSSLMKK